MVDGNEQLQEIQERTQGYLPKIAAALAIQKEEKESNVELVADADVYRGKVRDVYRPKGLPLYVVMVATGRQSAFDRQLTTVPYKGVVLSRLSAWWFEQTKDISKNHLVSVPEPSTVVALRCQAFPIEFVVRGYITGSTSTSLWTHYSNGDRIYCGITFPDGLRKNQKLDQNIVTPTTKDAEHDIPIAPADIIKSGRMNQSEWNECSRRALALFERGQQVASKRGLILVDTKYEFGKTPNGDIVLIDEIHTPDSSRFWLEHSYQSRFDQDLEPENIDKEFLRLWYKQRCDPYKDTIIPDAPDDLVCELARRYILLYELITATPFDFEASSHLSTSLRSSLIQKGLDSLVL
mmetsp:Transcript_19751/g.30015  ORF Transcript_19751/g.30015 Transcript_19751/m.30015 type:complete len:350 (-) Transcript_19751:121-1170(-)